MCTSFVNKEKNIIGMNFDNNGMKYSIKKNDSSFVILVNIEGRNMPSFGVTNEGVFINSQFTKENEEGKYKRTKNAVHMTRLVSEILSKKINSGEIETILEDKEIVNVPSMSCHSMLVDSEENVWIVEPGRPIQKHPHTDSSPVALTNFSLYDYKTKNEINGVGIERYNEIKELLNNTSFSTPQEYFKLLRNVSQNGTWKTDFSLVYSKDENKVYYCENQEFDNVKEHQFI
ncbi:hypothetical protein [Breznakia pachnodae]|uniref:Choloylglycine hydrolase/NAAA C-terminal domain-containing protein n=1 Tax=Breznakia pachnodae TaxID=265178 RepID=A0ABU0E1R7_9FIRM|nr:hypothetical protein [Breznakia pachnodae]MDQ0360824.1 hypothetical protein [Breznakia pachnodae]